MAEAAAEAPPEAAVERPGGAWAEWEKTGASDTSPVSVASPGSPTEARRASGTGREAAAEQGATGGTTIVEGPGKEHAGSWRDAIRASWQELRLAPASVCGDRETILGAVGQDAAALQYATEELRSDKALVVQAVRIRGEALRYASAALRGDREVVIEAIAQDRLALRHASEELRADVGLLSEAMRLRERGHTLQCAVEELGAPIEAVREASQSLDPEVWRTKVSRDWQRLSHAPAATKADRELVREAIRTSWGLALCYASVELQADRELVLEAVRLHGESLRYAAEGLRDDREIVLEAVRQTWRALAYASEDVRGDREVAVEALMQSTESLEHVTEALRADRDFMLRAVGCDGLALRYASEELREDREIVAEAFKHNNMALRYVPEALRREVWEASDPLLGVGATQQTTRWLDIPARAPPAAALPP
mmetsp:Transcript_40277/g.124384  ORF Transcript_40277/g.124384 Transcript_40277/m.124384 type:complete len:427 (+) Transcript_40277:13-1293(+)